MRDATVKMKDGSTRCAPIWEWHAQEGWMRLVSEAGEDGVVRFADVEEASVMQWVHASVGPERVDLLARARREGWDGR